MKSRDGEMPEWRATDDTAGSSTAAAATLFMNADIRPATTIRRMISGTSLPPERRVNRLPTTSATPVRKRAAEMKKIENMVITAGEPKPTKAFSGAT